MSGPPLEPRSLMQKRKGVMGRPRSNSCDTCRSKKVRCDEQRPQCGRCRRLRFQCGWPQLVQRDPQDRPQEPPNPRKILSKAPTPQSIVGVSETTSPGGPASPSTASFTQDLHPHLANRLRSTSSELPSPLCMAQGFPDIVLADSLVLTYRERRALHHYQNGFTTSRLTKDSAWSTYTALLRSSSQEPMVMHLLIAVSQLDLSRRYAYDLDICSFGKGHFQVGAQMLIDVMSTGSEPNHISALTSWLLIYYYMTAREDVDPRVINQMSAAALNYIKRHDLDLLCAGWQKSDQQSLTCPTTFILARGERNLLARLILFLYWKDIWCCFQGYGGTLGSHLLASGERMSDIYAAQTATFEAFWGERYPEREVIDDVENTMVLEFGHHVNSVLQAVNEFCQTDPHESATGDVLEGKLLDLEIRYSSIFRLAAVTTTKRTRLLQNADLAVCLFYAIKIYLYRCQLTCFDELAPPCISAALTTLMSIMHRTLSSGQNQTHEHHQIPLFMAGIETTDQIHIEWVATKLSEPRFRNAFQHITKVQQISGQRVTFALVRQAFGGRSM